MNNNKHSNPPNMNWSSTSRRTVHLTGQILTTIYFIHYIVYYTVALVVEPHSTTLKGAQLDNKFPPFPVLGVHHVQRRPLLDSIISHFTHSHPHSSTILILSSHLLLCVPSSLLEIFLPKCSCTSTSPLVPNTP